MAARYGADPPPPCRRVEPAHRIEKLFQHAMQFTTSIIERHRPPGLQSAHELPPRQHDALHRNDGRFAPHVRLPRIVDVGHVAYRSAVVRSPPATITSSARRCRLQHDSSCSRHRRHAVVTRVRRVIRLSGEREAGRCPLTARTVTAGDTPHYHQSRDRTSGRGLRNTGLPHYRRSVRGDKGDTPYIGLGTSAPKRMRDLPRSTRPILLVTMPFDLPRSSRESSNAHRQRRWLLRCKRSLRENDKSSRDPSLG